MPLTINLQSCASTRFAYMDVSTFSATLLQVIAEKVDKPRNIEFKGATDLVTDTDKASEEAVLSVSPRISILHNFSGQAVPPFSQQAAPA